MHYRQLHHKRGALPLPLGFHPDSSLLRLDELFRNIEAEAGALDIRLACPLSRLVAFTGLASSTRSYCDGRYIG